MKHDPGLAGRHARTVHAPVSGVHQRNIRWPRGGVRSACLKLLSRRSRADQGSSVLRIPRHFDPKLFCAHIGPDVDRETRRDSVAVYAFDMLIPVGTSSAAGSARMRSVLEGVEVASAGSYK